MGRALLVAFLSALALLVLFSSLGIALLWRLRRSNRLHPGLATPAPLLWLVHPGRPARLHRRLRAAVTCAHHRGSPGRRPVPQPEVDDLVSDLLVEAAQLDDQLVLAHGAPASVRRQILAAVEPQVAAVEALAGRLAVLVSSAARPGGVPTAEAMRTIEDKLDVIELSRQEIADLEAALHLDLTVEDRDRSDR